LLRFFEQRDFRSVGEALGRNEDAARMRVNRALEKLHSLLKRRGITLSVAALGTVLAAEAVTAAPVGLAATISTAALAAAGAGAGTALGIMEVMTMTKLKAGIIGAIVIAGVAVPLLVQHQVEVRLRAENQFLRQHVVQLAQLTAENRRLSKLLAQAKSRSAPRLPAPAVQARAQPNPLPTEDLPSTNLYARFKNKAPKLSGAQVEAYLKANGRTASSLLAGYRTSGDPSLLKEAMERHPSDPHVAFEAIFNKDLSADQTRQWLNAFEQSAPDNALANYLSALNYFQAGQPDLAVQELTAASDKQQFENYTLDRWKDDEDAYLSAGYSVAEAKYLATWELPLGQLAPLKQLGQEMVDLANAYGQSGDQASAQATLQMAVNLGQRYVPTSAGEALVCQSVGLAIERTALSAMDPNSPYGDNGQTVQDQLNQLAQQRAAFKDLGQQVGSLLQTMSDEGWINYMDRFMLFGELPAAQWLVNRYGQK
jgi:hypothetical protein